MSTEEFLIRPLSSLRAAQIYIERMLRFSAGLAGPATRMKRISLNLNLPNLKGRRRLRK